MFPYIPKRTTKIAERISKKTKISYPTVLKILCEITKKDIKDVR